LNFYLSAVGVKAAPGVGWDAGGWKTDLGTKISSGI